MSLAYMARLDGYALICDMAETYHILDWRSLPARLAATLAAGLRENSRIKMKLSGSTVSFETMLTANIADCLRILVWRETKDGMKGVNAPVMFTELITGKGADKDEQGFDSPDEFMAWRSRMIGGDAYG